MKTLEQEIEAIPTSDERRSLADQVDRFDEKIVELTKKKMRLGLFAGKEKKAIQSEIDGVEKERAPYSDKLKSLDASVEAKKLRVEEIKKKLLYPLG